MNTQNYTPEHQRAAEQLAAQAIIQTWKNDAGLRKDFHNNFGAFLRYHDSRKAGRIVSNRN